MSAVQIRKIEFAEIPLLADMPPPEWKIDLPRIFRLYYHEPYFQAFGIFTEGEIAGVGNIIFNGDVGWLGHIIVRESYRKQGMGRTITAALIDRCEARACSSIQLVASEMGEPVYAKLNFQMGDYYLFMRPGLVPEAPADPRIIPLGNADLESVFALDREATGEARHLLLRKFTDRGFVWREDGAVEGFFLPELGDGLIVARKPDAGAGLLQFKHAGKPELPAVLPEANETGVFWLQSKGFSVAKTAPRMYLKKDVARRPNWIYSRISGYLG